MNITRLGWAGLELEASGVIAVIDLLQDPGIMVDFVGAPRTALPGPSCPGAAALALVTHLHSDHADPDAFAAALAPDGVLLRPVAADGEYLEVVATKAAEKRLAELGVAQRVVAPWETVEVGPFRATAIPAADGFGDPQVSWVVEAEGTRILHAGDTLFHGAWWLARTRCGPFDAVFLPVNGPAVDLPHRQPPSPLPAAMDPEQAAAAAAILEADLAVPVHYDTINGPPRYVQVDQPAARFASACATAGVDCRVMETGETLELG
jgi:L-ascorbate metabolism protein UlaG (beta-lactamase superfamily)